MTRSLLLRLHTADANKPATAVAAVVAVVAAAAAVE